MNYKIQGTIKKNKKTFIIAIVLWLFIAIVLIAPLAYSIAYTTATKNAFDFGTFLEMLFKVITHPFLSFEGLIKNNAMGVYFKTLIGFTFIYAIIAIIGLIRTAPKNEYTDIEHGSSDWCENGEQYQVLSKNNGIILAENNYLPVDKRGNVNVLVVGRIRFW